MRSWFLLWGTLFFVNSTSMHETSHSKMRAFATRYLAGRRDSLLHIVDVGSRSVLGHQTYRELFAGPMWEFCGLDIEAGHNVDLVVSNSYQWSEVKTESFDVAISGQALEHVEFPWKTMREVFRILRPGGLFCLIVPSSGEEHRYPVDCWRFYTDSMQALAKDSGFNVVESFTDVGLGNWQDTFAVFQKPGSSSDAPVVFSPMENRDVAFSEYYKALSSRPKSVAYYHHLAESLKMRGRSPEARLVFRIGSEMCPQDGSLRKEVIADLMAAGEITAAAEHMVTLLGARPITPANADLAGAVFQQLAEPQRKYYAKLLPNETPALKQVARLAMEGGHYLLAAESWERLALREPGDDTHSEQQAVALWGTGRHDDARAAFHRLLQSHINAGKITRTTVIHRIIGALGAQHYLELGVERGINFFQIEAPQKFAVDPAFKIPGGPRDFDGHRFFEMPSDKFFESLPSDIAKHGIDVALIDGLHTYEQALRDVEHCLEYLTPGGIIVMHDCLPASDAEAAPSMEQARKTVGFQGQWTGDVYKAIIHLRATRSDVFVAVLDCDHGVGLVMKGKPESRLPIDPQVIGHMTFADLRLSLGHWLNLKPASWFSEWLHHNYARSRSPEASCSNRSN